MSWPNLTKACGSLSPDTLREIGKRLGTESPAVRVEYHDFMAQGAQMFSEPGSDIMEMEADHMRDQLHWFRVYFERDKTEAGVRLKVIKLAIERLERRLDQ